ncbi:MAG: efflux RND transporter permease subunit [Oligoflexia bacterium]|nr:efflux RND transporter permease subunit [Oligoflexia bacterium]
MKAFSKFLVRHAAPIALVGTLLALVGTYYSAHLYMNLRTAFQELLPATARSVTDLNQVEKRLRSIDNLAVLIFSQHPNESRKFVLDLAAKLEASPPGTLSSVEYRISRELEFFKRREALYLDLNDLIRIKNYVQERIQYEKESYNPLNIFQTTPTEEPHLDLKALRRKYQSSLSAYDRFPEGFYATSDETKRAILVYMAGEASSIDKDKALKEVVEKAVHELNPKSYAPDIEIKYTGGVQDTIEEHDALIEDLELSTIVVMVIVALAMILFFRAVLATLALVVSLFMGVLWTFGISYFAVGYLNANSAFLGSIVIGNGINCGIIFLARYIEERRKGRHNLRAILETMRHTSISTFTASLAAGLAYGSLILTDFRGFRQFGIIGLIGMILCWISAFTLLPAYLTLLDRLMSRLGWALIKKAKVPGQEKQIFGGALAHVIWKFPRVIWGAALIVTLISIATFGKYNSGILETDLKQLRNRHSLESGSAYLSRYLDQIFQRYLSPMAILPPTREDALKIAAILKKDKETRGAASHIASVQTIDDFIPRDQAEKIKIIREIRALLPPKILNRLDDTDMRLAKTFFDPAVVQPVEMSNLPPLLLDKFMEKDGSIGKLVLVEPPLGGDLDIGDNIVNFVSELRHAADSVAPGTAVAGSLTITADMVSAISHDGPKATLFALLAVIMLVVILFRDMRAIFPTLLALGLGVIWLAGLILGFWIKINFLNFIALPITFGIGVDYGVNIFQRFREEGSRDILSVVRHTSGAVALCSFTTIVGYSSLLIASNRGFVSFGLLAVAGELTCVTAAIVALPAFLYLRSKKKSSMPVS